MKKVGRIFGNFEINFAVDFCATLLEKFKFRRKRKIEDFPLTLRCLFFITDVGFVILN